METLFIGKNIIFLPETESTNSYATVLLKNVNLPEGSVVHTANQTKGKGQWGSTWIADPASNLTASVILKPTFLDLKNQYFLYQVLALACYDTLAELIGNSQFDIKIKWPNDILVDKKKIAGILLENNISNNRINWCVAGLGLNVNQEGFGELNNATSLKSITGKDFIIVDVLKTFCIYLEKYYLALKNNKYDYIKEAYLSCFFGMNFYLSFEIKGIVKRALVKGISANGLLLLEDEKGNDLEVDVKEAKWLY